MYIVVAALVSSLAAATTQSTPIFNPGAPGAAARVLTPSAAVDLGRTTFTEGDVRFMQHMLIHHGQAIEMVDLLKLHGSDPDVRRLGERIALSQGAEMALMREWLSERGQPLQTPAMSPGHDDHMHGDHAAGGGDTSPMPGMLTPNQMQALASARGPAFDRLFLTGMVQHHQGALDMVDALMAHEDAAEDPVLSDFATSVVADQSAEILRMQSVLSSL